MTRTGRAKGKMGCTRKAAVATPTPIATAEDITGLRGRMIPSLRLTWGDFRSKTTSLILRGNGMNRGVAMPAEV